MISKRQQQVLQYLKNQSAAVSIDEIARVCHCSNRTIRHELTVIEASAQSFGLNIQRKPSVGVRLLDINNPKWDLLLKRVNYHDKHYRQQHLLLCLLIQKQCTLKEIAKHLNISRQTITRDLNQLILDYPSLFENFNRSTHGCSFNTSERVVREVVKNTLLNQDLMLVAQEVEELTHSLQKQQANQWLVQIEQQLQAEFECSSFLFLESLATLYLFRSVIRPVDDVVLPQDIELFFTNNDLPIDTLGKELLYQALLGARLSKGSLSLHNFNADLAESLLKELLSALGFTLNKEEEVSSGLLLHLRATITRIQSGQRIENPLLEEVRVSLGLLYEVVVETIKTFEKENDLIFSEHEIAFIAMHLGALMQSQVYVKAPTKIAIVCQHGMATSRLLQTRVEALLPNHEISGPYSLSEFKNLGPMTVFDYVITTVALGIKNELVVHPILTNDDIALIEKTIWNYTYWKQCDILINNYRVNQEDVIYMNNMIKKQHMVLSNEAYNYKQAIKIAAKPLVDDGIIENSYVEKMIWAVETLGPYMVILPEVAFVHAAIEDGVHRNGISLLRLDSPILFGKANTAPVKAIFVIASKSKEDRGLLKLVRILEEDKNVDVLLNSNDIEAILALKG